MLEEARKNPSLENSEGAWPCEHLDLWTLASHIMSEKISIALSHPVCGILLWQAQETNIPSETSLG